MNFTSAKLKILFYCGFLLLCGHTLSAAPDVSAWEQERSVIEKNSQVGDARAQGILSSVARTGAIPKVGKLIALALAKKSAAAESPFGFYSLARCYSTGTGVEKDKNEAERLHRNAFDGLLKSADAGDVWGKTYAGRSLIEGYGVEKNTQAGLKFLREAAEQGFAPAQFELGSAYFQGRGVEQDLKEAAPWIRKAAEQGFAPAQFELGSAYFRGSGVEQDLKEAAVWTRKAAEQGLPYAQRALGALYWRGQGVEKNLEMAVRWYSMAAKQERRQNCISRLPIKD